MEVCNPGELVSSPAEMEFATLAQFDTGHVGVFWSEAGGPGPWEMHPGGDELLYVLEG